MENYVEIMEKCATSKKRLKDNLYLQKLVKEFYILM